MSNPLLNIFAQDDNETTALQEFLTGYKNWTLEARRIKTAGGNPVKELEYAEAYKLLLNKFSQLESD